MELLNLNRPNVSKDIPSLRLRKCPSLRLRKWWREQDSNLRRQSQKIYSLPPLATWVSLHFRTKRITELRDKESWLWDSNPQPADYKSAALPIELNQHKPLRTVRDFCTWWESLQSKEFRMIRKIWLSRALSAHALPALPAPGLASLSDSSLVVRVGGRFRSAPSRSRSKRCSLSPKRLAECVRGRRTRAQS